MKRKVILVAPHFQEYCLLLANALSTDGDVTLFISRSRLESEYKDRHMPVAPGVTIRSMQFGSPLDPLRIFFARLSQPSAILHLQEASGLVKSVILAISAFLCGLLGPVVLTVHDPLPHGGRDAAIVSRIGRFRRYVRRKASLILVHGAYCRDAYIQSEGLMNQHIAMVDHGIILRGEPVAPKPDAPLALLHFGRMEAYKGIDTLYQAVRKLSDADIPFTLHIAGAGPELDRLSSAFSAMPQVTVDNRFIPAISLIDAIRAADCIVLPYLSATQSGVLTAAFANSRFVIASNVGGIPDMVRDGENGLLTPPGDVDALTAAITQVAKSDNVRKILSKGAAKDAVERLDWLVIATRTREHYRAVSRKISVSNDIVARGEVATLPNTDAPGAKASRMALNDDLSSAAAPGQTLLSIGIKALNEEQHIEACLRQAVEMAEQLGGEVLLADSGSTDRTVEIARQFPVRILQFADLSERSCGAGAQLSFQEATGKYFYMLDGDMVLSPGFLGDAIRYLEENPHIGGVGGIVNECNTANEEFQIRETSVRFSRNWLPGIVDRLDCGGLYRTDAIRDAGYFADRNLHAFEEFDLAARLRANGWSLARIPNLAVNHYGHVTGGYRLLMRRIRSGYSGAPGEVLRGALMQPHMLYVLKDLGHIRYGLAVILLWWIPLVAGMFISPPFVLTAIMLVIAITFLSLRRRSFRLGLYSLAAWNTSALGLILGLMRKRKNPRQPIQFKDITNPDTETLDSVTVQLAPAATSPLPTP